MYLIFDVQQQCYLEWSEKTLRDVVERLISFHSIDCDMRYWNIFDLLELEWQVTSTDRVTYQPPDLNRLLIKKYKQGKWRRQFKKIIYKYNNYVYRKY